MEVKRGNLLQKTVYDNQESIVSQTTSNYTYIKNNTIHGLKTAFYGNSPASSSSPKNNTVAWRKYKIYSFLKQRTSTNTTIDGLTTSTSYTYDGNPSGGHSNPIEITVNGGGITQTTNLKYPTDVIGSSDYGDITEMINRNMVGVLLESTSSGETISGSKTKYSLINNKILPEEIFQVRGSSGMQLVGRVVYTNNDVYPDEVFNISSPHPVEYIWKSGNKEGLVESKEFLGQISTYHYEDNRQLSKIVNIDQTSQEFTYDGLQRLDNTRVYGIGQSEDDFKVKNSYIYNYGSTNSVTSTTIFNDGTSPQESIQIFDGLGRPISTSVNGLIKNEILYDNFGRVAQQTYLPGSFSILSYEPSPLNRVILETYPDGSSSSKGYGSQGNYFQNTMTDENGNTTTTLTDILGRNIESIDALGNSTIYEYTPYGNIDLVKPPNWQSAGSYDYTYDNLNRLSSKSIPSGGLQRFVYNDQDLLVSGSGLKPRTSVRSA